MTRSRGEGRFRCAATTGSESPERVKVIDWRNPGSERFLLVSKLSVSGEISHRRADLVGFGNGLPLVFIELKASHRCLEDAYDDNLRDYRDTIPAILVPNAFIMLSNGSRTRLGSMSSGWEHFAERKKIDSESQPSRLLDIVEHFVAFSERPGGLVKLLARCHQYLGVIN